MPARSSPEWEQVGTDETDPNERWESGHAITSIPAPPASSFALSQPGEDPQPFNPQFQHQTGMTDWINVMALGAHGDGVTDDLGIFQAANLIAQQPPGRMIYIPAGTYKLSSSVTFSTGVQWLLMGSVTGGTLSGGTQLAWGGGGGGGITNPMTTSQDLIVGGTGGTPTRLGVGANGTFLGVSGGVLGYSAISSVGFANPMTTPQDLIVGGTAGAAGRLGVGANGQVLGVSTGAVGWVNNPAGFSNPMTNPGDLILGGTAGAAGRLAQGATGTALKVGLDGSVKWAVDRGVPLDGPDTGHPTVFQLPDGSILVVPLSFYSLTGDDSVWINDAFNFMNSITGGGSAYGGQYNGPWLAGTIRLLPMDYVITSGVVFPVNQGATVNLIGHGPGTRLLVGSGAVGITSHVCMSGPQVNFPALQNMGRIQDLWIDGQGVGQVGMEIGGGWGRHIDVACSNFYANQNCIGLHLNNAVNPVQTEWMEKCRIVADLKQNSTAVVIENTQTSVSGSSFEYNDFTFYINARAVTNAGAGVVLQGGAYLSGGSLIVRGNFPTGTGPVLTISGNDAGGTHSAIYHEFIDVTVEGNGSGVQTIKSGNGNNNLNNCMGLMSFQFGGFSNTNMVSGQFSFGGIVFGDSQLTSINQRPQGWL